MEWEIERKANSQDKYSWKTYILTALSKTKLRNEFYSPKYSSHQITINKAIKDNVAVSPTPNCELWAVEQMQGTPRSPIKVGGGERKIVS